MVSDTELFEPGHIRADAVQRRVALPLLAATLDAGATVLGVVALTAGDMSLAVTAALLAVLFVTATGGYRLGSHMTADRVAQSGRLVCAAVATGWATLIVADSMRADLSALESVVFVLFLALSLIASRALVRALRPARPERVVVVGAGVGANRIADLASRHRERRFEVIGCLDDDPAPAAADGPAIIGRLADLPAMLSQRHVDRVLVAFGTANDEQIMLTLRKCDPYGVPVDVLPRFFELIGHRPQAYRIGGTPLLTIRGHELSRRQRRAKRVLDVVAAGAALALTAIPCLAVAALIKLGDGGPVFFRQRRIGKDGVPFEVVKFRTMVTDAEQIGDERIAGILDASMSIADAVTALKPQNDPRITRLGRVLRATSLDELPQFINVLRGEMSLVGPRPLRDFEVDSLSGWERDRQKLQPGLTGLWQVSGRSSVGWEERLGMDYLYVRHWSLASDMRILCETVPSLLAGRGAR